MAEELVFGVRLMICGVGLLICVRLLIVDV